MEIEVYGRSDDLLEIRGDLKYEFSTMLGFNDQPGYLAFSDGTVLKIDYNSDGFWKIRPEHQGTASIEQTHIATQEDYTDRYELDGEFEWILLSEKTKDRHFKRVEE